MPKHALTLTIASLLAGASLAASAAGHGHGGGPGGGMPAEHMSAAGLSNTNGPQAADRDKGLDRAEDRMGAAGDSHSKARLPHGKRRHQGAPGASAR